MKLDARALAYVSAALWGGTVLLVGLVHLAAPDYGRAFLEVMASVYPGYTVEQSLGGVLVATGYALVDGAVLGWLLGWLYNRIAT